MWRNIVCKMILKHATHVSIIIDYINCHPKFPYKPVTITGLLILQTAKLILDLDSQVNFLKSDVNEAFLQCSSSTVSLWDLYICMYVLSNNT